jgi:serine protease
VVRHTPDALDDFVDRWLGRGLISHSWIAPLGMSRLSFSDATRAEAGRAEVRLMPGVSSIAFDQLIEPYDDMMSLQAEPPTGPGVGQWHLPLIGVAEAWQRTQGEGVVLAVVDTGVKLDHPDLAANLLSGHDFVDGDDQPNDLSGHGTHVAGLAAANGAVLGTAPQASILPVRVLAGDGGGSAFTVAQGILWAAGLIAEPANPNPARVINLSLGTSGYSEAMAQAVKQATEAGAVVVAATGNAGSQVEYPASLPDVVAVTALAGPKLAYQPWYANRGIGTWVTAFGGDMTQDQDGDGNLDGILSTDLTGYGFRMGTSMAAPQVAGIAALALAAGAPPALVRDTLAGTATELGVMGYDHNFGHGIATGRAANASEPRSYVVALDEANQVLGWTLVQVDGSYSLGNLPPGTAVSLIAMSDEDGDAVLGEAGELTSEPLILTVAAGETTTAQPISLTPSDGSRAVRLEKRP